MTAAEVVDHVYEPRGACAALFECRDPEVLLSGPAGTGKSMACLTKLHMMALLNPGMRALIVRKTAVSLATSAVKTFEKHVAAEGLRHGWITWFGGSQKDPAQWRYSNGSTITVGGMDRPTKVMSTDYDIVYVQEAIELTVTDWEALTTRLRNYEMSFQQLIADTNPDTPTHWLKDRCDTGQTTILESRHEDNPTLFHPDGTMTDRGRDYIEGKLDRLTGVRKSRLRYGQWVAAEGQIWDEWDPAVHLVTKQYIGKDWPRWWVVDFGFTNPFVLSCWAEDPDGRLYRYREIYRTRRLVEDHARHILTLVTRPVGDPKDGDDRDVLRAINEGRREWTEPRPRAVICDHDAEDRATLEKHLGMSTKAAKKTVSAGLQAVKARLQPAGDGRPRLFLLNRALVDVDPDLADRKLPTCTEQEIPGYVWADKRTKEEPVKENDHGCDTVRYLVAERDLGSTPGVRWLG